MVVLPAVGLSIPHAFRSPSATRTALRRARGLALALAGSIAAPAAGHAQDGDGVYGRLSGDLSLSAGIGGGVVHGDRQGIAEWTGTATLELRARVLDMAGLLVAGEWRPEGDDRVVVAADVRPLFFARWLLSASSRRAWLDLLVDSIGIDLGVAVGPFEDGAGVALAIGFGLDVPLYFPEHLDPGVFLRLSARHAIASPTDQLAPRGGTSDWVMLALLDVRAFVLSGLAGWEPARYRVDPPDEGGSE